MWLADYNTESMSKDYNCSGHIGWRTSQRLPQTCRNAVCRTALYKLISSTTLQRRTLLTLAIVSTDGREYDQKHNFQKQIYSEIGVRQP